MHGHNSSRGHRKERFMEKNSLCCCKNLARVGADGIYRAVMSLHLCNGCKGIHVPELEGASPAAAEQNRHTRHQAKSTNPVLMSIRNLLKERRQAHKSHRAAKNSGGTSSEVEKSQVVSLIPVLQQFCHMALGGFCTFRARRVLTSKSVSFCEIVLQNKKKI